MAASPTTGRAPRRRRSMPKRRPEHQPQRTCAVCREVHPKRSMTRVVRRPDGTIALDLSGKASGRGTYVCDQASCREPKPFAEGIQRALGGPVAAEEILAEVSHASA
ncbi:MAG: YlxR family protein [Candidatus Limnocylindria bacterium]